MKKAKASRTTRSRKLDLHTDETLADRRVFGLNSSQWKAFIAALDAPPRPLSRMERLLKEPGFFDGGVHQWPDSMHLFLLTPTLPGMFKPRLTVTANRSILLHGNPNDQN